MNRALLRDQFVDFAFVDDDCALVFAKGIQISFQAGLFAEHFFVDVTVSNDIDYRLVLVGVVVLVGSDIVSKRELLAEDLHFRQPRHFT